MTYRRFELPGKAAPVATVATTATESRGGDEPVATVATVAGLAKAEFEERAAIVEHDGRVPRPWAEGFARLSVSRSPVGFAEARWRQLLDDGGRFLDRWAEVAVAHGWSATDVFGVCPQAPAARYEGMGLVALILGGEVIEVGTDRAIIRSMGGGCLTYYLRRPRPDSVAVWDLVGR